MPERPNEETPEKEKGLNRRDFLIITAAGIATGITAEIAIATQASCRKIRNSNIHPNTNSDAETPKKAPPEKSKLIAPPKITFGPYPDYVDIKLPDNMSQETFQKIAKKYANEMQNYFNQLKRKVKLDVVPRLGLKIILETSLNILGNAVKKYHPNIKAFFEKDLLTRNYADIDKIIQYLNQILATNNLSFYLEASNTIDFYFKVELFETEPPQKVYIDEFETTSYTFGNPISGNHFNGNDFYAGTTIPKEPFKGIYTFKGGIEDTVNKTPHTIYPLDYKKISKAELIKEACRDTAHHESIHFYLHSKYPKLNQIQQLSGKNYDIEELCARAATVSTSNLLSTLLSLLVYCEEEQPTKDIFDKYLEKDGYDWISYKEYVKLKAQTDPNALQLFQQIGREIYDKGLRLLKATIQAGE